MQKFGIYLRISLEDGDKQESNSIDNQRKLIYEYLHKNNFVNKLEFIDDGATGTNFNRKGFKELLQNIENGNINTVITKDVSRIGRNYVKTGYYIEDYFLNKGVRYISVLDNIDTYMEVIGNELLPFRAILNDMYSKDISLKQRSSLKERKRRGRYIACFAPYGYKKNKEIKGKLDIDEESAKIVKRTFNLVLQGYGPATIAKLYTEEKISTPARYMNMTNNKDSFLFDIWKVATIKKIIRNKSYLGYMIQNKETTISHKNHKRVFLDEDKYIIIKDHHLPIIEEKDFIKANEILDSKRKKGGKKKEKTILHDYLYCEECKKKLYRKDDKNKIYYYCATRTMYHICENKNYINYFDVEKQVFEYIKNILNKYSDENSLKQVYINEYSKNKTHIEEYKKELSNYTKEINKINNKLDIIYNDKLNNIISADMYKKHSSSLKLEQKKYENKIKDVQASINNEENKIKDLKECQNKSNEIIKKFKNLININEDVANEFIEKISINQNRDLHIKLKYNL